MMRDGTIRLTREGITRLEGELEHLSTVKLPDLTTRIQEANQDGDVSDNSEYEELKEELVLTDARIHELRYTLDRAEVLAKPSGDEVSLGSTVTIRSDDGEDETWRLVSPEEADTRVGAISTDSPVGHALMGSRLGDTAVVTTPAGDLRYTVVSIS